MSSFASYSGITIPEGKVKRITRTADGAVLWEGIKVLSGYPAQSGTLTYSGKAQSPSWSGYDANTMTLGGTTSGTNAGNYTATFTPKNGYVWPDGTDVAVNITWTIGRVAMTVPSQKDYFDYDGSEHTVTWNNYDSSKMSYSGTKSATNAGTYTVTFTPKVNYMWSDGSIAAKSIDWEIFKAYYKHLIDGAVTTNYQDFYVSKSDFSNGYIEYEYSLSPTLVFSIGKIGEQSWGGIIPGAEQDSTTYTGWQVTCTKKSDTVATIRLEPRKAAALDVSGKFNIYVYSVPDNTNYISRPVMMDIIYTA